MKCSLRSKLTPLLGRMPPKADLDLAVRPVDRVGGVERQMVSYNVAPGERVDSYLLMPAVRTGKRPGVLAIHQHAAEYHVGKSEPAGFSANVNCHYGLELAQRGFVVLCPDILGFEDRRPSEWRRRESRVNDDRYEWFLAAKLLAEGSSVLGRNLHDCSVALDVLASLESVDADRLGVTGHSMGGTLSNFLAFYDPRIAAAASSCGCVLIQTTIDRLIAHCFTLFWPGLLAHCDMDEFLADLAPKPYFCSSGQLDTGFPVDSARRIHQRVAAAYDQAGVPDNFQAVVFDGGHGFPPEVRRLAYDFLANHLRLKSN